jgi:C-terminal processing protease CtpA/Prc
MERRLAFRTIVLGLALLVLSGLVYLIVEQQRTLAQLRGENRKLHAETSEMETLRAEASEARRLRNQEAEIQLLRDENQDLMRLRNEVHQLREQQKETEALRTANAGLLQAMQGTSLNSNQQAAVVAVRKEGAVLGLGVRSANDPSDPLSTNAPYNGAVVTWIDPASPIASSGIKVGDIIVRVEGRLVENTTQLQAEMLARKPGDTITLDVMRNSGLLHLPVKTRGWPQ